MKPCVKCGKPGRYTWNSAICALDHKVVRSALCADCDIAVNEFALSYSGLPRATQRKALASYKRTVRANEKYHLRKAA